MSTLSVPPVLTSPQHDAVQLYKAFKGFGCDTGTVVDILAHRDATQRALIQQEYRTMYSDELTKRLSSELSGDLKRAVLLWMHDPAGRDATIVRQALTGDIIDLKAATEVICSRSSSQIQVFKQAYHAKFGVHLEHDLNFHTSSDHLKLLLAYVSITRYEGPEVDRAMVDKDAKVLYKAGEKKLGTDEKTFIHIFSERSRPHLAAVSIAYHHMYGNSLKKAVKSETSGLFEDALLTILRCAENPAKYFAKVLHKAMKGMGTNDTTLIRVVVSRTEIDMQYIKAEYQKKYRKPLGDAIHSETSGHYRAFLLALVGPNH
ncbi:annexin D5-like [Magnolia sinica]|uniref:annexin D5-like n=1 Tax=Magnolia sinica TaxID=86752 RepID=UPI00265AFA4F|nr:annexin D5-like [Magnolia sinica]